MTLPEDLAALFSSEPTPEQLLEHIQRRAAELDVELVYFEAPMTVDDRDEEVWGFWSSDSRKAWVAHDLDPELLFWRIAHELGHAASGHTLFVDGSEDVEWGEAEAWLWAIREHWHAVHRRSPEPDEVLEQVGRLNAIVGLTS